MVAGWPSELNSNIAIIDDDVLVRQALGDCMESAGYAVESFGSAEEFLASGAGKNVACLIIDVQLPGISGLELQDKLAEADKRVPTVFVSAQATRADREKALNQGAVGFLSKPFRRDDLVKLVEKAIQR
jgi:FixJ family two-component response regulator